MSGAQRDGDQSMDDILASIRKIISDDGAPGLAAEGDFDEEVKAAGGKGSMSPALGGGSRDDLSDILEDPNVGGAVIGDRAEVGSVLPQTPAKSTGGGWAESDQHTKHSTDAGSLTDKLASLGSGRGNSNTVTGGIDAGGDQGAESGHRSANVNAIADKDAEALEATLASVRDAAAAMSSPEVQRSDTDVIPKPAPPAEGRAASGDRISDADLRESVDSGVTTGGVVTNGSGPSVVETVALNSEVSGIGTMVAAGDTGAASQAVDVGGKSIEALVAEALQPMLQQWLDANLPRLVEEKLQEELKRRVS